MKSGFFFNPMESFEAKQDTTTIAKFPIFFPISN